MAKKCNCLDFIEKKILDGVERMVTKAFEKLEIKQNLILKVVKLYCFLIYLLLNPNLFKLLLANNAKNQPANAAEDVKPKKLFEVQQPITKRPKSNIQYVEVKEHSYAESDDEGNF